MSRSKTQRFKRYDLQILRSQITIIKIHDIIIVGHV
jgi:hypothetical protein